VAERGREENGEFFDIRTMGGTLPRALFIFLAGVKNFGGGW